MPIEPLKTDEKLPQKAKQPMDMDSLMLVGCTGFVTTSLLSYGLGVWPFLAFQATHMLATFGWCALFGFVPASILGWISARRFGLPGACGYLGGAMAVAIFLHLRIQQVVLGRGSPDLPQPQYPDSFAWMAPLAWLLLAVLVAVASTPKTQDS